MKNIRPAAVAGSFYPAEADLLRHRILGYLHDVNDTDSDIAPKALIVPHAGYIYSGPIAAHAYARLRPVRRSIRRVILLGPAHRVAFEGLAHPGVDYFATPLGAIPIDTKMIEQLCTSPSLCENADAHKLEHSLEVQLPFLQTVLDDFTLVPLAVGKAGIDTVAAVLDACWGANDTLILISSDLSHFHPYPVAQDTDRKTAQAILDLNPHINHQQACGATPINGLLQCVKHRGLTPKLLDLRNSADTAGDPSRVVGYASFAFFEAPSHEKH